MTRTYRERRALYIGPALQPGSITAASTASNKVDGARDGSGVAAQGARSQSLGDVDRTAAPSGDVAALVDRLRTLPETRTDRVQDVVSRLERGEYLTRQAAEQTAAVLVGSRTN